MLLSSESLLLELFQIAACMFPDIVVIFSSFDNFFYCSMFHLWRDFMSRSTFDTRKYKEYQNMKEFHLWIDGFVVRICLTLVLHLSFYTSIFIVNVKTRFCFQKQIKVMILHHPCMLNDFSSGLSTRSQSSRIPKII